MARKIIARVGQTPIKKIKSICCMFVGGRRPHLPQKECQEHTAPGLLRLKEV